MKRLVIPGLIFLISYQMSHAQISTYKGQALFVYNFTKHIKWQAIPDVFTVGVLGKSDIYGELTNTLKGKQIEGKAIQIINISTPADASKCKLIYLPSSKSKELNALLSAINTSDVLLVTEDDLSAKGAAISFITVEDKLRFKINSEALTKGGMQVSGGLLSLALK